MQLFFAPNKVLRLVLLCIIFFTTQNCVVSLFEPSSNVSSDHVEQIKSHESSTTTNMISGAVARACAQLAVFPFDCIKTRQQVRGGAGSVSTADLNEYGNPRFRSVVSS
jgi:hypothetical protein